MTTVKEVHSALKSHIKNCDERNGRIEKGLKECNTGISQIHARMSRMDAAQYSRTVKALMAVVGILITAVLSMSWDRIGG